MFLIDIIEKQEKIMQGLTDLQNSVTGLTTVVGQVKALVASLNATIASLQATIAAGGDNDAAVETQAKVIAAQVSELNGVVNPTPAAPAA